MAILADIDEIVTEVRDLLDEAVTDENKFWSDTQIIKWANIGAEKFTSHTRVLSKRYSYTVEAADVANDRELRLSSDFITFDEGGVICNDKKIEEISLAEVDEWKGNAWRDRTATNPIGYYRRGDMIGFVPSLAVGDTVVYFGIERAPTMVAADGVAPLSGDYRLVAFRTYIVSFALARCWYKKKEFDLYREQLAEFWKGVGLVNSVVHGEKNQVKRMIPARRRTGRRVINALNM